MGQLFCFYVTILLPIVFAKHFQPAKQHDVHVTTSVPKGSRIIGGTSSKSHQWPFIASIQYHDGYHFCGGSLIRDKWVLTAAHCTGGIGVNDFRVVLGDHTIGTNDGNEQIINVTAVHTSPFYNLQAPEHTFYLPYDLALVELEKPAVDNGFVRQIDLPNSCIGFEGQFCTIIGWGRQSRTSNTTQNLQHGDVKVIPIDACRNTWGSYIYYGNMCVFSWDVSACQGDSGGPLVCLTQNGYTLVGLSSWGDIDCGDYPSIFTQVAEHLGWINDIMDHYGTAT